MNTYECAICMNINHASHVHCSTCGAIPAKYSILGEPSRFIAATADDIPHLIPVVVARGADRAEQHRNMRVNLRTALADYSE